jgi:hypothetical protein
MMPKPKIAANAIAKVLEVARVVDCVIVVIIVSYAVTPDSVVKVHARLVS